MVVLPVDWLTLQSCFADAYQVHLHKLTCLAICFFGALSGSSVAAASAMGGCIYPIQKDEGYDPAFASAVNIASASYWSVNSSYKCIYCIFHCCWWCINFRTIYGGLYPWNFNGSWSYGSCIYLC